MSTDDPPDLAPRPPRVEGACSDRHVRAEHVRRGRQRGASTGVAGRAEHPVLERVSRRRRHATALALVAALVDGSLLIVSGALFLLLTDIDPTVVGLVGAVLSAVVVVLTARRRRSLCRRAVEAGTSAVGVVDGQGRGPWVETDRLAEVELRDGRQGRELLLRDLEGRSVALPCGLVEANASLWSLVHGGIASSEIDGARIDPDTRSRLALPAR